MSYSSQSKTPVDKGYSEPAYNLGLPGIYTVQELVEGLAGPDADEFKAQFYHNELLAAHNHYVQSMCIYIQHKVQAAIERDQGHDYVTVFFDSDIKCTDLVPVEDIIDGPWDPQIRNRNREINQAAGIELDPVADVTQILEPFGYRVFDVTDPGINRHRKLVRVNFDNPQQHIWTVVGRRG